MSAPKRWQGAVAKGHRWCILSRDGLRVIDSFATLEQAERVAATTNGCRTVWDAAPTAGFEPIPKVDPKSFTLHVQVDRELAVRMDYQYRVGQWWAPHPRTSIAQARRWANTTYKRLPCMIDGPGGFLEVVSHETDE